MTNTFDYWFKHKLLDLPYLASEHGKHVDDLIVYVHCLMGVLFVGWLGYFLYTIFRFRKSKHPKADYVGVKGHVSNWVEGGVAVVEAVLLIGFAVPLWAKAVTRPPVEKESTVIHVLAKQFNWNAHYAGPDGVMGRQDPTLAATSGGQDPFGIDRKNDPHAKDDVVVMGNIVVPVNKPVVGAGLPRYGSQLNRKCCAPNGTSVTRSSGSFDCTGLAGGSNATTPFAPTRNSRQFSSSLNPL